VERPYAESCVQNREPILQVICPQLPAPCELLEVGSGTGQHAVYFGSRLPHVRWQPSDRADQLAGIQAWVDDAGLDNVPDPIELDVLLEEQWPRHPVSAVFSANTVHIMGEPEVAALFSGVARVLKSTGVFLLYGPFNYRGRYTSESNRDFDRWLKERDPHSGIKDLDWLCGLAAAGGLELVEDCAMPVNNRTLIWRKT